MGVNIKSGGCAAAADCGSRGDCTMGVAPERAALQSVAAEEAALQV